MADASPIADAALNDATLLVALRELIQPNKLEELSMKKVMKALRETFGDGVRARKPWILEQVTAIVDYARHRGIRVVPEFDMPGHGVLCLHTPACLPLSVCTVRP